MFPSLNLREKNERRRSGAPQRRSVVALTSLARFVLDCVSRALDVATDALDGAAAGKHRARHSKQYCEQNT
jgi:hypothetical protein